MSLSARRSDRYQLRGLCRLKHRVGYCRHATTVSSSIVGRKWPAYPTASNTIMVAEQRTGDNDDSIYHQSDTVVAWRDR